MEFVGHALAVEDKMMNDVKASIIMSAYNARSTIGESIESILAQTFRNYEFIIIDDASTDDTVKIIKQYKDSRIRLFCNVQNVGLTKNLNKALKIANGKYIVRMDADDISMDNRLERQIAYMDKNPQVMLSSCSSVTFGKERKKNIIRLSKKEIKALLIFQSVLPHPGFIFRSSLIQEGYHYNENFRYAQDYEFQAHVAEKYEISCLSDCLIKYRVSNKQISIDKYEEQMECANRVRAKQFMKYGICLKKDEAEILKKVCQMRICELNKIQRIRAILMIYRLKINIWYRKEKGREEIDKVCNDFCKKLACSFNGKQCER